MKELIIFIIIAAISYISERVKAANKKRQEQANTPPVAQPDAWDQMGKAIMDTLDKNAGMDGTEKMRERLKREREEILARKAEEQRKRAEAEEAQRELDRHRAAESAAAKECVTERVEERPAKPKRRKAAASALPDEGGRSTVDALADSPVAQQGSLTPDDLRRAVVLDAIFHRPSF